MFNNLIRDMTSNLYIGRQLGGRGLFNPNSHLNQVNAFLKYDPTSKKILTNNFYFWIFNCYCSTGS